MRMQLTEGYLYSLTIVPEKFTSEELRKHYEQHQEDYAVWKKADSENSKVTQTIQSFEDAQSKVEWDLRLKCQKDVRKKVAEEIRSRSTVEILVELE